MKGEPDVVAAGEGAAWVAGFTKARFHRIDAATNEVTSVVDVDTTAVAVGEGAVWLLSSGALRRIDPTTLDVTPIEGSDLCGSAVSVGGGSVWAGCLGDIGGVDPSGSDVSVTTDVVPDHDGLVYGDDVLWLTDSSDGRVYRLDPAWPVRSGRVRLDACRSCLRCKRSLNGWRPRSAVTGSSARTRSASRR